MSNALTFQNLQRVIKLGLLDQNIENADQEARWIIEHLTGMSRAEQILINNQTVDAKFETEALEILNRRLDGEPLDHIFGYREFYGLRFEINRHVLSPRPETEMLVDFVLEKTSPSQAFNFLDLGTGSGAVAIAILAHRPHANAIAIDVSEQALLIAKTNCEQHAIGERLKLVQGDWASSIIEKFDFIVSNPPYIDAGAMKTLEPGVRDFDPEIALFGGNDGLAAYRIILEQVRSNLKVAGRVALEIGFDQGSQVADIFRKNGYSLIQVDRDLSGQDRLVSAVLGDLSAMKV